MPYQNRSALPVAVRNVLPAHAQDIYKEAFNSAWDEYKKPKDRQGDDSREEITLKVSWAAVAQGYQQGDADKCHPNKP